MISEQTHSEGKSNPKPLGVLVLEAEFKKYYFYPTHNSNVIKYREMFYKYFNRVQPYLIL